MDPEGDPEEGLLEEFVVPQKKAPKEKDLPVTALATVNSLQRYLAEIRHFPALSKEEEFELAVRYKEQGDSQAAHRLVTSHLLLVVKIAMLYRQVHSNLLDLIQEGNIGLLEAIKRFDPYRNLRLSTYAAWWIRAYILKFILDNWKLVKVGTSNARRKLFYNLKKEKDRLEAEGNGYGSRLLAERLQVKEDDVIDLDRYLSNEDISLDAPLDLNSSRTYADRIASDELPIDEQLAEEEFDRLFWEKIHCFSEGLSPRDRLILEQRLLAESPMTLQEIGEKHGVTRETVRQAEKRLLRRLRTYLKQELPDYINVQVTPMSESPAEELSAL
ncbi:MAG: RNA polymerase factor sigma-32 [Candidatus Tectomicrobia bacterium]|uniref:RNA polymerase sigma factor n=1 Tax=Tectimicrobiota bacterium TaxID=2528274 RepID=A0A932FW40_UNCTE|nr:RNA polymerase factor sigma-32 [Candidatus Tectomicrobia bacterium]